MKQILWLGLELPFVNKYNLNNRVSVLSIAARANAKSLHALWPIRAPTFRLCQSERHIPAATIRARELSSRLSGQRRILTHVGASRLHTHVSSITRSGLYLFQYTFSSPLSVFGQRAVLCLWSTTVHFTSLGH